VLPIRLPRCATAWDLDALVDVLADDIARRSGLPHKSLSPEALDLLAEQAWPGNIRELRNVLEQAALMTDDTGARLALDIGDPGPSASSFGPSTLYGEVTLTLPLEAASPGPSAAADARATRRPQRRSAPALAGAAALLAIGVTAVYFSGGPGGLAAQPAVAPQAARGAAAAASVAPAELEPAPVAAASAVVSTEVLAAPLAPSVPGPLRLAEAAPPRPALARPPLADPVPLAQPAPTPAAAAWAQAKDVKIASSPARPARWRPMPSRPSSASTWAWNTPPAAR
jgi:hypothetical protein